MFIFVCLNRLTNTRNGCIIINRNEQNEFPKTNKTIEKEVNTMTAEKLVEFYKLLSQLPPDKQNEIYYMIKGAALVAHNR